MSKAEAVQATLSIGEVARRTGLTEGTIRAWERRHGFPAPPRQAGGHRRYSGDDVEALRRAAEERRAGASVADAIRIAASVPAQRGVFASLRAAFPELAVQPVGKVRLVGLSHAIEDEIASRAGGGLLAGAFQRPRFFRAARRRWLDMAAGTELAFVLAAFRETRARGPVRELAPLAGDPILREWILVWDGPGAGAHLVARERPGQDAVRDPDRLFDVAWGVDPQAVRHVSLQLADAAGAASSETGAAARACLERIEPAPLRDQLRLGAAISTRALASLAP